MDLGDGTLKIPVLDKGYVRFIDKMGNDLTAINAAKASFLKQSKEFGIKEQSLLEFLIRNNEFSPFRHATLQFEIKAPIQVCRQWWKYAIGSQHGEQFLGWNEASRRYLTTELEFFIPKQFYKSPDNKKQGSDGPVSDTINEVWRNEFQKTFDKLLVLYNKAIKDGICAQQARGILPGYNVYTIWQWTASLQAVLWFLHERLAHNAQDEIREYATQIYKLTFQSFPKTVESVLPEYINLTKGIKLS